MTEALEAIADRFHPREGIKAIRSLGSGNVNETFLVTHEGQGGAFVMQRLNTNVFDRPDLVMQNLQALGDHMERRLASPPPQLKGRRWEVPRVVPCRREASPWIEQNGEFWRSITYIGAATTSDVIRDSAHAHRSTGGHPREFPCHAGLPPTLRWNRPGPRPLGAGRA